MQLSSAVLKSTVVSGFLLWGLVFWMFISFTCHCLQSHQTTSTGGGYCAERSKMCTSEKLCADLQWTLNHASKFLTAAQHKPLEPLRGSRFQVFPLICHCLHMYLRSGCTSGLAESANADCDLKLPRCKTSGIDGSNLWTAVPLTASRSSLKVGFVFFSLLCPFKPLVKAYCHQLI